ncbi:hypothetical protein KHF85_13405 [Xanthomonas translucens pv. graminis]|uniref:hypothetical protein n=1 Tax=Xanthomonas graminis TaxID=3390026 RepID=UPI00254041B3|nr:hypothetical protein [Xanthomonas translucens]WIH03859.1 hypothetical protein KHF85_13405 [Xanthomonas translucens pv. graminis]
MLEFSKFNIIRKAVLPIIAVSTVLAAGSTAAQNSRSDFEIENHVGNVKALLISGSGAGVGCHPLPEDQVVVVSDKPLSSGDRYTAIGMSDRGCSAGTSMAGFRLNFTAIPDMSIVINNSGITIM